MSQSNAELLNASELFDEAWYLEAYPDVATLRMKPAEHYLKLGTKLLRDPGPHFSTAAYLEANDDVKEAGMNPLLHYLLHGHVEGRDIYPAESALTKTYDVISNVLAGETGLGKRSSDELQQGVIEVYNLFLGRHPSVHEQELWIGHLQSDISFLHFFRSVASSKEAQIYLNNGKSKVMQNHSDGEFILFAYNTILRRGCSATELENWRKHLGSKLMGRREILGRLFDVRATEVFTRADSKKENIATVMGTSRRVGPDDWQKRAAELATTPAPPIPAETARFYIKSEPKVLVSTIASLYKGGKYIERFMDNITSQSCFKDYAELIIIDANSPENEAETIKRYLKDYPNINYQRTPERIAIYDAWNVGVNLARGDYLTNTNLDDLRRQDSLELQAATLDSLPFVDVVYQDFYYSFDPNLSFEDVAAFNFKSNLPIVTFNTMLHFNPPHNAPMWRRALHDEVGYFDESYKTAGDYEFWMRCLVAGKTFYKLNDAHVVYYQNPEGLSTRGQEAEAEMWRVTETYCKQLLSSNVTKAFNDFIEDLDLVKDNTHGNRYESVQHTLKTLVSNKFAAATKAEVLG